MMAARCGKWPIPTTRFAHDLLLGPSRGNPRSAYRTDAVHLPQAVGLCLDHVEHLLAEGAYELLGVDRTDAKSWSLQEG